MSKPGHVRDEGGADEVQSVKTMFDVLEAIQENGPMGVTELSRELDMSKGGVHRYLKTLVNEGYAVNDDGRYDLGLRFLMLAGHVRQNFPHNDLIEEKVTELANETGQRAQFLAEQHGYGIYLYRERATRAAKFEAAIGKTVHLHTTAAGKAILAHMPRDEVEGIIDRHGLVAKTDNSITDPAALFDTLAEVREQGYALNEAEHLTGLHAVGVPVFDSDDTILGGMSVSGPSHRIKEMMTDRSIQQTILSVAEEVELGIKYS
jgi:DNA-binding IclR family transcriptional regulator